MATTVRLAISQLRRRQPARPEFSACRRSRSRDPRAALDHSAQHLRHDDLDPALLVDTAARAVHVLDAHTRALDMWAANLPSFRRIVSWSTILSSGAPDRM
jgi:hypothetical protein